MDKIIGDFIFFVYKWFLVRLSQYVPGTCTFVSITPVPASASGPPTTHTPPDKKKSRQQLTAPSFLPSFRRK